MSKSSKSKSGSLRDYVSKYDEPDGKYRVIKWIKTPVQRIAVVKTKKGEVLIYGDGYAMFGTSKMERMWAELMVHVPMAVSKNRSRVLQIGGGGGILAREALRYRKVKNITVVDADPAMMKLGRTLKPLVKFNGGALNNPKVTTMVKDGRSMVENSRRKWDVIIIDVPEPTKDAPGLRRLYSLNFYRLLKRRLNPGGAVAIACTSFLHEMPEFCGPILRTLKAAGFYVLPYYLGFGKKYEETWGFCLGTTRPISRSDVKMRIKTRVEKRASLKEIFSIPKKYRRKWKKGKIQTDRNHVLRDIHEKYE